MHAARLRVQKGDRPMTSEGTKAYLRSCFEIEEGIQKLITLIGRRFAWSGGDYDEAGQIIHAYTEDGYIHLHSAGNRSEKKLVFIYNYGKNTISMEEGREENEFFDETTFFIESDRP